MTLIYLRVRDPTRIELTDPTTVPSISGTVAATETQDVGNFTALGSASAALTSTETPDIGNFSGLRSAFGTLATTEAQDTGNFTSGPLLIHLTGGQSPSTTVQLVDPTRTPFLSLSLATTEAYDVGNFAALGSASGTFAFTETPDFGSFSVLGSAFGTLATTEAPDVGNFTSGPLQVYLTGGQAVPTTIQLLDRSRVPLLQLNLTATETQDVGNFTALKSAFGTFATTEKSDVGNFTVLRSALATLATTEAQDIGNFTSGPLLIVLSAGQSSPTTIQLVDTTKARRTFTLATTERPDAGDFTGFSFTPGAPSELNDITNFDAVAHYGTLVYALGGAKPYQGQHGA